MRSSTVRGTLRSLGSLASTLLRLTIHNSPLGTRLRDACVKRTDAHGQSFFLHALSGGGPNNVALHTLVEFISCENAAS